MAAICRNSDTVTAIGDEAFLNNKTMIHVLIPDSVTSIGESAFGRLYEFTVCEYTG